MYGPGMSRYSPLLLLAKVSGWDEMLSLSVSASIYSAPFPAAGIFRVLKIIRAEWKIIRFPYIRTRLTLLLSNTCVRLAVFVTACSIQGGAGSCYLNNRSMLGDKRRIKYKWQRFLSDHGWIATIIEEWFLPTHTFKTASGVYLPRKEKEEIIMLRTFERCFPRHRIVMQHNTLDVGSGQGTFRLTFPK